MIKNIMGAQSALGMLIGINPLSGVGAGSAMTLDDGGNKVIYFLILTRRRRRVSYNLNFFLCPFSSDSNVGIF
jgi:hypothetical protein